MSKVDIETCIKESIKDGELRRLEERLLANIDALKTELMLRAVDDGSEAHQRIDEVASQIKPVEKRITEIGRDAKDNWDDYYHKFTELERQIKRLKFRFGQLERTLSRGNLLLDVENEDSVDSRVESLEIETHNLWANREDRYEDIKLRVKRLEAAWAEAEPEADDDAE